ncbi:molybdopterin-dependent oxidoreductase [Adhaeribacter pallidiroseus]|uniref:Oxidoreductase molybdopterin-binding domain-containing protein n=1 Tax=Adhaeribacter pallidiroseus TaxID=2072847 RepID=A0A369QBP3_9BACT|nr:molybdopterin-dependent oxidoreductase [Adhaeribacter pallidiroseus]RDC62323.1 hypothetical protein AHMF7616_00916 [Adhaeribacter pallidiroseus]
MKLIPGLFLITLFIFLAWPLRIPAQTANNEATVKIAGEVKTEVTITSGELDKMKKITVVATDRNNQAQNYTGVLLATLLQKSGVTLGEELKGKNLKKYVLLEARDGYQVVFSLAEIDPVFSEKKIILANRLDGNLLNPDQGPFQIIVEGEKKKARFIRQVTRIAVHSAN